MHNNLIIGRKALIDLLKTEQNLIEEIFIAENAKLDADLISLIGKTKVTRAGIDYLDELSEGTNHQGVISKLKILHSYSFKDLIKLSKSQRGLLLAIDQIQDPHNLGAILRVADAMGVDGLIKTERHCASEKSPTVAKTSCGASYLVPISTVSNLANAIQALKKEGFWIIGSSLSANSQRISSLDTNSPVVLILGGESKGMRRQTEELCDYLVHIPMMGKLQSLNVSTACSILLYEINRLVFKQI